MKRFPLRSISTFCSSFLAACIAFVVVDPAPAGPTQPATDHSWDIAVIDRALASAKPGDPWVKFGDVGIKYADLKVFRDRLAGKASPATPQPGVTPEVVTPPGTTFKWPSGNVNYRFDPIGLTNGTVFKMTPAGVITTLHSFTGSDGSNPIGALVRGTDGNFYGTTQIGGTSNNGTVFKIASDGTSFTSLHSFAGTAGSEGSSPAAGLVQGTDGNFYGTTQYGTTLGGTINNGTIFKITSTGTLTTLYSFSQSGSEGMNPVAGLVQGTGADTNFYGTTQFGGGFGQGTVFKITPTGTFTNLHSFTGSDGSNPVAGLVRATDGNFYGVTQFGGTNNAGTVFKITSGGTLTTIHSFNVTDGYQPVAGLFQGSDTNFYGTTQFGGASNQGTAFKITSTGTLTTLHSFVLNDGQEPVASLVQAADTNFYGTVFRGGANADGTAFEITSAGAFTPLHTFTGADGTNPMAGLIQGAGTDTNFYGTTPGTNAINAFKMQQFRDGVAEWAAFANLHFIEFTTGVPPTNFITVQEKPANQGEGGFSSSVGMAGGEQFVKIGQNSWNRGTICHEVGHALGLYHEQQRSDRDTYVVILTQNIIPGQEGNFTELPAPPGGSTNVGAYDFYSIMHYERNALSVDRATKDTIQPQPAYAQYLNIMGRVFDRTLSKLDRAGMGAVAFYGPPASAPSAIVTNTNDSGSGSLRAAIYYAFDKSTDAPPVPTTVTFQIPTSDPNYNAGTGVFTIRPTFLMVAPGAGTTIDGSTQTAFTGDTNTSGPEIVIDGSTLASSGLGLFAPGFLLHEMNCTIKNLVVNGFNQQGIVVDGTRAALFGTSANGNVISGCYIGTDRTGGVGAPNTFPGIEMFGGASNNTIGGTTTAARNVISGNSHYGISIHDNGSTGNLIVGNYIGLNATGTAALANTASGIGIFLGAQNNTVGGTTAGARNVISGNNNQGIAIEDSGTTGNSVLGNYIGTNAAGTSAIANGSAGNYSGVEIFLGAQSNTIGGTVAGSANVISGNAGQGIVIADSGTTSNLVRGNMIGLNAAQTAALPNTWAGVSIFNGAQSNTIGGLVAGSANIISGNGNQGITISGTGTNLNLVQGNFIGTNAAGTAALGNTWSGVAIFGGAQSNTIGGLSSGARNLISGNSNQGVVIADAGTNLNLVQGNYIGVNAAGTAALPNAFSGISLFNGAQSNTIGGASPGARNIISGNTNQGMTISDSGTALNLVQGNYIGLDVTGVAKIGNASSGIDAFNGAHDNVIGGTSAGARNYISGNTNYGISFSASGTNNNSVQGNTIGLNILGAVVANGLQGVALFSGAQSNTIGGSAIGASNIIAGNTDEGVATFDATTIKNSISQNSIFSNHVRGIGVYTNSSNNQAAPTITPAPVLSSAANPNGTDVSGTLSSTANTNFRIEFFASPAGNDEGQFFIGATNIATNGAGAGSFTNVHLPAVVPAGYVITATATDPNGNTSQFSPISSFNTVTAVDSDSDGIPDNWMNLHFMHPTGQASDNSRAGDDADGTGMTNLQKFLAGLDPKNPNSVFRISSFSMNAGSIQIGFPSVTAKTYQLQYCDDLVTGNWNVLVDQIFGTGTTIQIADPTAAGVSKRFYRLHLEP